MGGRLIFSPNFYVHDFDCLEDITFFLDFFKRRGGGAFERKHKVIWV